MKPGDINPVNTVIALKIDRQASQLSPIETIGLPLTIGATATASSEKGDKKPAGSIVANDLKQFYEGIMVKTSWSPAPTDKDPWIQVTLPKPETISQIRIREGKFGDTSKVETFAIEAMVSDKWEVIHSGTRIGGDFNLILDEQVTSSAIRLHILEGKGQLNVNLFELYGPYQPPGK